jgi:F0F1-type ATP synthase assembly protein I
MKQTKAPKKTPSPRELEQNKGVDTDSNPTSVFISMVLDMTWRLALVVILPIVLGSYLDTHFKKSYTFMLLGLLVALIGAIGVIYQSYKGANKFSVMNSKVKK